MNEVFAAARYVTNWQAGDPRRQLIGRRKTALAHPRPFTNTPAALMQSLKALWKPGVEREAQLRAMPDRGPVQLRRNEGFIAIGMGG